MPFDLRLSQGDLVIDPFDLQLNTPGLVAVAQRLAITLSAFKGEYFLNTDFGAPWYQTVLRKGVSQGLIDGQLRSVISSVEGVIRIIEYSSTLDPTLRCLSVTFKAQIDEGVIDAVITTGGGAPILCIYNPPDGNNVIFMSPLQTPATPPITAADLDFNCDT